MGIKRSSAALLLFALSITVLLTPCAIASRDETVAIQAFYCRARGATECTNSSRVPLYGNDLSENATLTKGYLGSGTPPSSNNGITLTDKFSLVKEYFPVYKFSLGEKWYPCSFYFDEKGGLYPQDFCKKESYDSYTPWPPPYYAYVHVVETNAHISIQYWLYYVWNEHLIWPSHYTDWDSTVFVILNRTQGEPIPLEIYYFHHLSQPHLSWKDWPEFENGTHPIVYVAGGSHGAYPTQHMESFDEWQAGGTTLSLSDFSWYLVGDSTNHAHSYSLNLYCNITVDWVYGKPQWEFAGHYWPRLFPQKQVSQHDPLGSPMISPWHRPEWMKIRPDSRVLSVAGSSKVNILVTDPSNLRVGYDLTTGTFDNVVEDALYSGPGTEPQVITIQSPTAGLYTIDVIGTSWGNYTITVESLDKDGYPISGENFGDAIFQGEVQRYIVRLLENGSLLIQPRDNSTWIVVGATATSALIIVTLVAYHASPDTRRKRKDRQ
jgi:hypothetical protein